MFTSKKKSIHLVTIEIHEIEDDLTLVSSSVEETPLGDWAGLIHSLHPKLRTKVQEWLQKKFNPVI